MELFIRIRDGQPFEHPILGDNFRQAFPEVDVNNLPPEFARFERIAQPVLTIYEVYEGVTYERDGEVFKDVHHVRPMTAEEITATQDAAKDAAKEFWAQHRYASWIFNEATCQWSSPVPMPTDGQYRWDEATISWVELAP